jgi:hypothetical protein
VSFDHNTPSSFLKKLNWNKKFLLCLDH